MKVHYFYYLRNDGFYDIRLSALMEEDVYRDGNKEKSFKYIEDLKVFISTDMESYQSASFKIEFGKDSCYGHSAKSRKELYAMLNDCGKGYKPVKKAQYKRLRKIAFAIYQRETCMDFALVAKKQDYNVRIL